MLIRFCCPTCRAKLAIDSSESGSPVTCTECGRVCTVPPPEPGPGVVIGGFMIERLLGAGGMGEVYLARQLSMDRPVALKILPFRPDRKREDVDRFVHEVRVIARLEHPNIVTAYEAGEENGLLFMAMAYVNGEGLDRTLAARPYIPEAEALRIIRKIARALQYAWDEHKLLHLDLKPGNILMDANGEPKLIDLGLSRSLAHPGEVRNEIAGTPNYMSPEQARGEEQLDTRADMYSLGATLYHMVTGQIPHGSGTPEATLERKLTESLPDPRTFNPALSAATVALLQEMLGHQPSERPATWRELIEDIDRALHGRMPLHAPAHAAHEKVRIRASEIKRIREDAAVRPARTDSTAAVAAAVVLLTAMAIAIMWAFGLFKGLSAPPKRPAPPPHTAPVRPPASAATNETGGGPRDRGVELRKMLNELEAFRKSHTNEPRQVIARIEAFRTEAAGSVLARRAAEMQEEVEADLHERVGQIVATLAGQARPLEEKQDFEAAAAVFEAYDGPLAEESAAPRKEQAAARRAQAAETAARARDELVTWIAGQREAALDLILRADFEAALRPLRAVQEKAGNHPDAAFAAPWAAHLDRTLRVREIVLAALQREAGRSVELRLGSGTETWEIMSATNGVIRARRAVGGGAGFTFRSIPYENLHPGETFARLEGVAPPVREVLRGLFALKLGSTAIALKQFELAGDDDLARTLRTLLATRLRDVQETDARRAFGEIMSKLAADAETKPDTLAQRIRRTAFRAEQARELQAVAAQFRQAHGQTEFFTTVTNLFAALEQAGPTPREMDPEQIQAAITALQAANPALPEISAKRFTMGEAGLEVNLASDPPPAKPLLLEDLTPLTKLPVARLYLAYSTVRDLTPLRQLPLAELDLSRQTQLDFAVIRSLPVKSLKLEACGLDSLMPLRGMPLEGLSIVSNKVSVLQPLQGMPLKHLNVSHTEVNSFHVLQGMALESLTATLCSKVDDLRPLKGMPLKSLVISHAIFPDLVALKGMPLENLSLRWCAKVTNLAPLEGMPLKQLALEGTHPQDFTLLARLPLEELNIGHVDTLGSLECVRGHKTLKRLRVNDSPIKDLLPIAGMPLTYLDISTTAISSIAPLRGMPLEHLNLEKTSVRDLGPLAECPKLVVVWLPANFLSKDPLRNLPNLRVVFYGGQRLVAKDWLGGQ